MTRTPHRAWPELAAVLLAVGVACATPGGGGMTQQQLGHLIHSSAGDVTGPSGKLQFVYGGVAMACVSDPSHDRMRIIAPITQANQLDAEVLAILLTANFHTALDGRYALSEGVVYAVYLHPLSSLGPEQLESGMRQVANLARTFGTTFSSGELNYGAPAGEPL